MGVSLDVRPARALRAAAGVLLGGVCAAAALGPGPTAGATAGRSGAGPERIERIRPVGTVDLGRLASAPAAPAGNVRHLSITPTRPQTWARGSTRALPQVTLGGSSAPGSPVTMGGDNGNLNGISSIDQETGGTGNYANKNSTLEPPDQGLCTGAGYVIEAVNDALRVYTTAGAPATPKSVPLNQFFQRAAGGTTGPTDFISDPRCLFDHATQRWFVTILDVTSVPAYPSFNDDRNFIAVSTTSNPTGSWTIFSFDVTDNGLHGSPVHAGCIGPPVGTSTLVGCLGDQPTIGADANGIYITDNEYALAEVFPVAPPVVPPLQQIPVLRSGVGQLYALSKHELVTGSDTTLVRFDSSAVPFPGAAEDSPWQTISPAQPVPSDPTPEPAGGVEYFMSEVGLPVGHNAGQVVVWAWTGTASLGTGLPSMTLQNVTINTASPSDTFFAPDPAAPSSQPFVAYQKDGPHPTAAKAGDPEEYLNANDDRMSWVTLSNGHLWTGVNTLLPPTTPGAPGHAGENRVGIMYFEVTPRLAGGLLQATTTRDGYISVPDNNVLFPSVVPRADGATVITFTLAGIDHFPSEAWARVDGLAAGAAPVVHIARLGAAPEDGFTGLGTLGSQGLPDVPPCGPCVARWGDYSASQVDESGCIWGAAEYVPTGVHDSAGSTDWGTGIYHVCLAAVIASATPTPTSTPAPTASATATATPTPSPNIPNTAAPAPAAAALALATLVVLALVAVGRRRRVRS